MRTEFFILLLGLVSLVTVNCATTSAPNNWLPPKSVADRDAFGGWMTIESASDQYIRGELIAATDSGVFVMIQDRLSFIGKDSIKYAKLGKYEDGNPVAAWGLIGTLSTATHGFVLLISAPLWVLTSTVVASDYASQKIMEYPDSSLISFRSYARFPQGLPPTIDRQQIKPKNYTAKPQSRAVERTDIKLNHLHKPFQLRFNKSFNFQNETDFNEALVSAQVNVFDWFYAGAGFSRNKYVSPSDEFYGETAYESKTYNYSPFLEIGKDFKLGTVNPYVGISVYANWFDHGFTNDKFMYAVSLGANTMFGTLPVAFQSEIKKVFIYEKPPFLETQRMNTTMLNVGLVYFF